MEATSDVIEQQPDQTKSEARKCTVAGASLAAAMQIGTLMLIKGKTILFAVLKIKGMITLITMAFNIMAYWWFAKLGLPAAIGFILLLFVHEMGHVMALRYYGVDATSPLFLPFMGAFIQMKGKPRNAVEEAIIALAGPVVGSIGALICFIGYLLIPNTTLLWLFASGVLLNLFNLIPASPLDGGRIVGAVWRGFWFFGVAGLLCLAISVNDAYLALIGIICLHDLMENFPHTRLTSQVVWSTILFVLFASCLALANWGWLWSTLLPFLYLHYGRGKTQEQVLETESADYRQVSVKTKLVVGAAYASLVAVLGTAFVWVSSLHAFKVPH